MSLIFRLAQGCFLGNSVKNGKRTELTERAPKTGELAITWQWEPEIATAALM